MRSGRRWPNIPTTTSGGARATRAGPATTSVPAMLVVGGTFDAEDCYGAWNLYKAVLRQSARTPLHLVVGPWAHGAWRGDGRTLGDFDFGEEASGALLHGTFRGAVLRLPPLDRATRSIGCRPWRPSRRATTAGMRSGGGRPPGPAGLTLLPGRRRPPHDGEARRPGTLRRAIVRSGRPRAVPRNLRVSRRPKEYMVADQRFLAGRKDVLTFVTEPLAEDVTLAGPGRGVARSWRFRPRMPISS